MTQLDQALDRTNRSIAEISEIGGISIESIWRAIDHGAGSLDELQKYRLRRGLTAPIPEKRHTELLRSYQAVVVLPKYRRNNGHNPNKLGRNQYGKPGNWGINRAAKYLQKRKGCCNRAELFAAIKISPSAGTLVLRKLFQAGCIEKHRCKCEKRYGRAVCYRWVGGE